LLCGMMCGILRALVFGACRFVSPRFINQ
jgi:hypothetical protein